ncbi:MAG TPA: bifunctional folylpolyglutamate synthase/dihydrofolate synthase, partial [bacterium]|nr:bifunctional folylpolyglutamate synthase/dihydrofolate synthase [bacterium]
MTYRQAIDFLEGRERFGIRLGLANMSRLLAALGEPQRGLKVFHVAGTNGKGSTARLTAGLLQASGFRVGLYTSPHLLDTRERVQVDQRPVSRADFTRRIEELAPVVERLSRFRPHSPTYFEVLTALAFRHFALEKVDFAVIEV